MNPVTEENTDVSSVSLLNLPCLVISKLLTFLDLNSLKNLRLVNHSLKSWVESEPQTLKRFYCHIHRKSRLTELTASTRVPWNNFAIWETYDGLVETPEFLAFMSSFGKFTRKFFLASDGLNVQNVTPILEYLGPQLESLWIKSTICSPATTPEGNISFCFPNLKELGYLDNCSIQDYDAEIFRTILLMCPNLRSINLTRAFQFISTSDFSDSDEATSCESLALKIIYEPLLEYLKERGNFASNKRKCDLSIDLNGCRKILIPLVQGHSYPLTSMTLLSLAKYCQPIGAKLLNVPEIAFPKLETLKTLSKLQIESLDSVITSIQLGNRSKGSKDLFIPPSSKIIVDIQTQCSEDYSQFEISGQIEIFRLWFFHYEEPILGLDILYRNIFQRVFLSVRKLKVQRNNTDYLASGREIAHNFPNLQKLELTLWGENETDFNDLLRGLPNLVSLSFPICENCTDRALLGPDFQNPLICQLKNLTGLKLLETKTSDLTFQHGLKYMRLRKFEWCKFTGAPEQVTFKNGISTLQTIENGFWDTVHTFKCEVPHDCTSEEFSIFKKGFKNLKFK